MAVLNHLVTALATILLITPSLASTSPKDLAKVAAQFKTAGIVPDVLPRFNPSALAYLTFVYPNSTSSTITSPGLRIGRDGKYPTRPPSSPSSANTRSRCTTSTRPLNPGFERPQALRRGRSRPRCAKPGRPNTSLHPPLSRARLKSRTVLGVCR